MTGQFEALTGEVIARRTRLPGLRRPNQTPEERPSLDEARAWLS